MTTWAESNPRLEENIIQASYKKTNPRCEFLRNSTSVRTFFRVWVLQKIPSKKSYFMETGGMKIRK
jgi:hypothetical protein